ncbi:MAG: MGMT family protein [Candidatus Pacebacteria bacterium]|nr:MGMT family protein [Candidatus Paceibacterota bacterium]
MKSTFAEHVREVVRQIPKGETRTYGEVAAAAGRPGAARAVGTIMKNNYDPTVPCHRVIRSDGKIGEYNRGGSEKKRALLKAEGAFVSGRA